MATALSLPLVLAMVICVGVASADWACQAGYDQYSFCNTSLPIPERVRALLALMTLDEKIANTYAQPYPTGGVSRLGVPKAKWWNEATHGAAISNSIPTTFFPMPSFTACAFNLSLVREVANLIGKEYRAAANILSGGNYNYWAPHINLVRDPRWGRAQETPGEDPFLNAKYAIEYVRGLQEGDPASADPRYLQCVATAKHFSAYDWEGVYNSNPNRFNFDAHVTDQDLADTFNVPFQAAVQSGRAAGVMCSYTSINGVPSCANKQLLQTTLRDQWDFEGYIVGDCGAVENVGPCDPSQRCHNYTHTNSSTVAAVLVAGVTMDCGHGFSQWLGPAVSDGSVTEEMIDAALFQDFSVRFRAGEFDPRDEQPYAKLGNESICTPYASALSQRVAEEAVVLLKYSAESLPLPSGLSLALIGPNANNTILAQMCSYYSTPCGGFDAISSPLNALPSYVAKLVYSEGCDGGCSDTSGFPAAITAAKSADATVLVVGLNCHIAGEGCDRSDIALPGHQGELITSVCAATSGRCIVVVYSGSSLDMSAHMLDRNVDAILFAGYPGPWGGDALARVLFGHTKPPAGRLSQTWYTNDYVSEVDAKEMHMRPGPSVYPPNTNPGHTHRFYNGSATLFPFGYGLSFTTFVYSSPFGPARVSLAASKTYLQQQSFDSEVVAEYSVNVTNTGTVDSDDVVLGFLVPPGAGKDGVPLQELFGFQRVFVCAGETVTVWLGLTARQLTQVNSNGERHIHPGMYAVRFGVDPSSAVVPLTGMTSPALTYFVAVDEDNLAATNPPAQDWSVPPRGWNAWFAYDIHLNETAMRSNADGLVRTGLAAAGFRYLNLDGGWQGGRQDGVVYPNKTAFPSGMSALVDYAHSLGLYFGGYTDRGSETCDGHVGSLHFEAQDAATYAQWGMDFVKEDSCFAPMSHAAALAQYNLMQEGINKTGRPMFFSLCGWLKWYAGTPASIGQSWRIGPDALSWDNVLMNFDAAADAAGLVGPAHFADIDEVMGPSRGRPINYNRTRTQASLIAIIGSPLLLSFDLIDRTSDDPDVAMFLNTEALAIHQDPSPSGPHYRRLAGLYVSTDKRPPLTGVPCNASDPFQQWSFTPTINSTTGTLRNFGTTIPICLHAGPAWFGTYNNAQGVWLAECGGHMCDPQSPDCLNQVWTVDHSAHTLTSAYFTPKMAPNSVPGPYVTRDPVPNGVFLEDALPGPDAARQQWVYQQPAGLLINGLDNTCMAAYSKATTNVWGRRLFDGAWALVFINFGNTTATVTCDAGCFAAAGLSPSTTLAVRDIWARTNLPSIVARAGYSVSLPPNGNSVMIKFTPKT